jgi:hypothetical protein
MWVFFFLGWHNEVTLSISTQYKATVAVTGSSDKEEIFPILGPLLQHQGV